MQPETKFKNKVLEKLKPIKGIWIVKVQQKSIAGIPDIIICAGGKFVAWELKVGSNNASPLQRYNIDCINKSGGIALVVTPENLTQCMEDLTCLVSKELRKLHK